MDSEKLTSFSRASGCGCKIAPATLHEILEASGESRRFDHLLVGYQTNDDAAIAELDGGQCIISTTDFFLPMVDDPFDFGYISAVNAINDVFAMGGKPVMGLSVLGWPVEKLGVDSAAQVIAGARAACESLGLPLAGGHSIDSLEPFFGLAVTGAVKKSDIKRNSDAQPGDYLYLTKPIGTGMIMAGLKRGLASPEAVQAAVETMKQPNLLENVSLDNVHAMTDVTGFGLLGHLIEMCEASEVSAKLDFKNVPKYDGEQIGPLITQFVMPDNTMRNFKAYSEKCSQLSSEQLLLLCDPQTSGGLLFSSPIKIEVAGIHLIGTLTEQKEKLVVVE